MIGLAAVCAVVIGLADGFSFAGESGPVMGTVKLVGGVLLVWLGINKLLRAWRDNGQGDTELPGWLQKAETIDTAQAFVLGAGLAAVNPKNLLIAIAAASAIAEATAQVGIQVAAVAVFIVVGSLLVAIPIVVASVAGERAEPALARVDAFVTEHNAVIVGAVLVVLGVVVGSNGLQAL